MMNLKIITNNLVTKIKTVKLIKPIKFNFNLKQSLPLLLLLIPLAVFAIYGIWQVRLPVERWDEFTNVSVVRESLASAQPLKLIYNQQPFLEKPPGWYYLTMLPVKLIGERVLVFRSISIVSGILVLGMIYLFVNRKYGRAAAMFASFSLLTFSQLFIRGAGGYFATHTFFSADLDGLALAFLMPGVLLLGSTGFKKNLIGTILIALSYLVKGPLALFVFAIIFVYKIIKKELKLKPILILIGSFLIILIPWHVFMYLSYGQSFLNTYLQANILQRAVTAIEDHNQSWYFYFELLVNPAVNPIGMVQVGLFLWIIIREAITKKLRLIPIIIVGILVLICFVQTKLSWYMLGIYPFLAIELGKIYNQLAEITVHAKFIRLILWILTGGAIIINFLAIIGS